MKSSATNVSISYVSLCAYMVMLVFGSGIHLHRDHSRVDRLVVHAHEASSPHQSHKEIFHITEDHQHFVAFVNISAIQSRNQTKLSLIDVYETPQAFVGPLFLTSVDHSPKILCYYSRQYSPHDGFPLHSSGSDPPFLLLV